MAKNRKPLTDLIVSAVFKFGIAFILIALLFFITAGTMRYWNGWLFLGALFLPMTVVLVYLLKNDPGLLEKRLKTKEREKEQKSFLKIGGILIVAAFLLPGLDYRFQWSFVPVWLVVIATIIMLGGYFFFFAVMRQNSYASRVVEIQKSQKLIDSGVYSIVRHPMYLATLLIYMSAPLVLGSYFALVPMAAYFFILPVRILNEEKLLSRGLKGYKAYMKKVKYRLIPFVW